MFITLYQKKIKESSEIKQLFAFKRTVLPFFLNLIILKRSGFFVKHPFVFKTIEINSNNIKEY